MQGGTEVSFWVDGVPVPADRPRATISPARNLDGRPKIWMRSTHRYEVWKHKVGFIAAKAMIGKELLEGALELEMVVVAVPTIKEKKGGFVFKRSRPDASNYLKGIEDAIEGIVFKNDMQIARIVVEKRTGTAEGIRVKIRVLEP